MNPVQKKLRKMQSYITRLQEKEEVIMKALEILFRFNGILDHIWVDNKTEIVLFIDVSVGEPKEGMKKLLRELAKAGYGHFGEVSISANNDGLNWQIHKNDVRFVVTALIAETTCKLVQVDTKTTPVYKIKCA